MNKELILALEMLEKEKGISKETLIETIEAALITAYKKNFPYSSNARVIVDPDSGEVKVYSRTQVVEEYIEDDDEMLLSDAHEIDPNYKIGDIIEREVTPKDFGRIAAQTAKQVVVQRIREAERNVIFDEFSNRESEIVTGIVQRQNRGNAYINLGKTEAVLIQSEQIPGESYTQHERIKTYIVEVKQTNKGPQVVVSRTHPGLVKRLFELEVPEIHDGVVEIKSIAREAGSRTKIAVHASDANIDAVGSCVGQRGARVQAIVDELRGEKIDIVNWSEDPKIYISNALSPSDVLAVYILEGERSALVVVPDHQLSLAIGKEGQNARLAAKLTGWKVDIKSKKQFSEFENAEQIMNYDRQLEEEKQAKSQISDETNDDEQGVLALEDDVAVLADKPVSEVEASVSADSPEDLEGAQIVVDNVDTELADDDDGEYYDDDDDEYYNDDDDDEYYDDDDDDEYYDDDDDEYYDDDDDEYYDDDDDDEYYDDDDDEYYDDDDDEYYDDDDDDEYYDDDDDDEYYDDDNDEEDA